MALDLLYARIHTDGHCHFNRHLAWDATVCEFDINTVSKLNVENDIRTIKSEQFLVF